MGPTVSDTFLFWTNKGGVGKTTLCFHSLVTYAELHPNHNVIVIDTDEQANLSQMLLSSINASIQGDINCAALRDVKVNTTEGYPRTLSGVLLAATESSGFGECEYRTTNGTHLKQQSSFLVNPHLEGYNPNVPHNVYLLCGDPRIVTLVPTIQAKLSAPGATDINPATNKSEWSKIISILKNFIEKASTQLSGGTAAAAFVDSNPSMTIWTQMALAASDKLVVPVNADDFSTAALRTMFFSIYGLYSFGGSLSRFEKGMFHNVMKAHSMPVPKVHAIIHNRSNIYAQGASKGFQAMNSAQAEQLFGAFVEAKQAGINEVKRIFNFNQHIGGSEPKSSTDFANAYTGTMRDMLTSAVATQHSGIPLWMIKRFKKTVKQDLNVTNLDVSSSSSLGDLLGVQRGDGGRGVSLIQLIQGSPVPQGDLNRIWDEFNTSASKVTPPRR